ncbi:MAG: DUF3107 domain-containing protein [Propionibacteriaceae bacterium]|nr:DUF3107 domain-containing protein [Propionibacteriaceae bacterium]
MEIKVGIQHVAREVTVESEATAAEIQAGLIKALADESIMTLVDAKGRTVLIPAAKIAYVDLGQEHVRPVGFGAV